MPSKSEYYVAFSIHGSNCFITASTKTANAQTSGDKIIIDGFSFTKGQSRTRSENGAQKLLSPELRTGSNKPLTNAGDIHAYFMKLRAAGWDVDDGKFVKKHGLAPVEATPTKPEETAATPTETKTEFSPETPPIDPLAAKMASASATIVEELPAPAEDNPAQPDLGAPKYDPTVENKNSDYGRAREPETNSADKPVFELLDGSIKAVQGDITKMEVDAIINAANAEMIPGGGVDGAINRAAGDKLTREMLSTNGCPTGYAVVTNAFNLNTQGVRHIIHAVGPVYRNYAPEEAAQLLRSAYDSAFSLARVHDCKTVAAPLLSTGVYGYPMDEACAIAVQAARAFNSGDGGEPLDIAFVAFDDKAYAALTAALAQPSHE